MSFAGFIFDFDGLILDTEVPRFTAWKELYAKYGFPLTHQDWWKAIGTGPAVYDPGQHLVDLTNGKISKFAAREMVNTRANEILEKYDLLPGVKKFIDDTAKAGLPMAIASSSSDKWVFSHLERFEILHYFKAVFTAQDVKNVKPDPELYLLARRCLGLPSESVLAFEDSPNGIKAAKQANLKCVAIPNQITREMDLSESDRIVDSFLEIAPLETILPEG